VLPNPSENWAQRSVVIAHPSDKLWLLYPAGLCRFFVPLDGIDSVMAPLNVRLQAWQRLAQDLDIAKLEVITRDVALSQATEVATELLQGQVRGRVVVDVAGS
jgi:acrylyl-CoA reductase (NADPH)